MVGEAAHFASRGVQNFVQNYPRSSLVGVLSRYCLLYYLHRIYADYKGELEVTLVASIHF